MGYMKTDHLYYALHHADTLPKKNVPLLILLHGYGSNEADMLGLGPYFDEREVNCVSVRAPFQLDTGGFAWFDIERLPDKIRFDYDQAMKSLILLNELVRVLKIEFESERVIIAGFSQGATMAMASGFKTPKDYSGIVALSGLCSKQMFPADPTLLTGLPVFVSHGIQDEVIPIQQARDSKNLLSSLPVALDYFEYEMQHTISSECLSQLQNWIFEKLEA
tara:strand:+ start:16 stop:675 length:660 start_codon:yes stop_codon:yes gene_type:complete